MLLRRRAFIEFDADPFALKFDRIHRRSILDDESNVPPVHHKRPDRRLTVIAADRNPRTVPVPAPRREAPLPWVWDRASVGAACMGYRTVHGLPDRAWRADRAWGADRADHGRSLPSPDRVGGLFCWLGMFPPIGIGDRS